MKDSPLEPNSDAADDIAGHVILWTHARQQRKLTEELAITAVAFAVVAFCFCLQALHFQHWVFAGVLGVVTAGAAWLFKKFRAQVLELHEVVIAYQAGLGELGWKEIAEADPEQTHPRLKHRVFAALAETSVSGRSTEGRAPLLGRTGMRATINEVKRIQSVALDLDAIALHESLMQSRFKTGLLLAGLGLAWGTYGLVLGVSLNALVFTAALAVAANAIGAKHSQLDLGNGTKEELLEFLEWFDLRTRYDADRSHLELISKQGKVIDPYVLKGVAPEADA